MCFIALSTSCFICAWVVIQHRKNSFHGPLRRVSFNLREESFYINKNVRSAFSSEMNDSFGLVKKQFALASPGRNNSENRLTVGAEGVLAIMIFYAFSAVVDLVSCI